MKYYRVYYKHDTKAILISSSVYADSRFHAQEIVYTELYKKYEDLIERKKVFVKKG